MVTIPISQANDPNAPVLQMGIGTLSCATWLSDQDTERSGEQWLFGLLTGLNVMAATHDDSGVVGKGTDQPGFVAAVKRACDEDRSRPLIWAATGVYARLKQEGRETGHTRI